MIDPSTGARQNALTRSILVMPGMLAQSMLFTSLAPGLPQLAQHFGGGTQGAFVAGMASTTSAVGLAIGAWSTGWMFELVGFRLFFAIWLAVIAVSGAAPVFVDATVPLLASRAIAGFATSALLIGGLALIPRLYVEAERPRILGLQYTVASSAAVLNLMISGYLVQSGDWRTPCWLYTPIFLAYLLLTPALPAKPPREQKPAADVGEIKKALSLWPLYLLGLAMNILMLAPSVELPFMLKEDGETSPVMVSTAISVFALTMAFGGMAYGSLSRRRKSERLLIASSFVIAAALAVLGLVRGVPLTFAALVFLGTAAGVGISCISEMVMRRNPGGGALAFALLVTFNSMGIFATPMVFGPLVSAFGFRGAMLAVGSAVAAASILTIGLNARNVTARNAAWRSKRLGARQD